MCHTRAGAKYLASVQHWLQRVEIAEGRYSSVPRNREPRPSMYVYSRPYVRNSAQRKLISFTVSPCVSPASNFTVRTGPQKRRSRPRTGPPKHRSLSRRHDDDSFRTPLAAAAVINHRVQPLHVSAVPARIFGSFGDSCILARGNLSLSLASPDKGRIGSRNGIKFHIST